MEKERKGNVILELIIWLVVLFAIIISIFTLTKNNIGVSNIMGNIIININDNELEGEFKKGDIVIGKQYDKITELEKDDIIFYYALEDSKIIVKTGVITDIEEGKYLFYIVDNEEEKILSDNVIATYHGKKISSVGHILSLLQTKLGFICFILLPLVLFFIYRLRIFIKTVNSYKK